MGIGRRISRAIRREGYGRVAGLRVRLSGSRRARRNMGRVLKTFGGGVAYGTLVEPRWLETTLVEVSIADLPPALDGYRIAHLTDIHYSMTAGRNFLARVVEKTNALDPDLVALTGDFIAKNPKNLHRCMSLLSDLRASDGLWASRGNHDYHASIEQFRGACLEAGIRLLENQHAIIRPTRRHWNGEEMRLPDVEDGFVLAGVGDMWEGECSPGKALHGVKPERPIILMSHNPQCAELISESQGIDLILSGHTHGGQIRPLGKVLPIFTDGSTKYASGLVESEHTVVYISRGVGTSSLYFRWNCRPEIALITLRSPGAHAPNHDDQR